MISQNLTNFYNNWSAKADNITSDNLESVYDRYITLFVIYNFLYNQVPIALIASGVPVPNRIFDNKAATDFVVQYLGATNILTSLQANGHNVDIQGVINLIDQERFYIKLNHGQRQRNEDLKILANLNSENEIHKATAILQVCYYVRCNIFHGSKDFVDYQRLLLEPLTNIMRSMVTQLFNALSN